MLGLSTRYLTLLMQMGWSTASSLMPAHEVAVFLGVWVLLTAPVASFCTTCSV